jgi:hypothetical protein
VVIERIFGIVLKVHQVLILLLRLILVIKINVLMVHHVKQYREVATDVSVVLVL